MAIRHVRRENMRFLVEKAGSQTEFARRVGTSAAYVSQVLSEKSRGDVGNRFAVAIEKAFDLKTGWLDDDHSEDRSKKGVSLLSDAEVVEIPNMLNVRADKREFVPCQVEPKNRTFAYKITSDQMQPIIPAAAVLICEPDFEPAPGDIVIIAAAGGVFVRTFQKDLDGSVMFKPENPRYPVAKATSDMKIIGVVLESIVTTLFRKAA